MGAHLTILVSPTLTSQVRDLVYTLGQQTSQGNTFGSGIVLANASGTITKRVILNDTGTSLILVNP